MGRIQLGAVAAIFLACSVAPQSVAEDNERIGVTGDIFGFQGATAEEARARTTLLQAKANRLNAGLTDQKVHEEMIRLVPRAYWRVIMRFRYCQELKREKISSMKKIKRCEPRVNVSSKVKPRWYAQRKLFASRSKDELPWNPRYVLYRSSRLLWGASEEDVLCEIAALDFHFEEAVRKSSRVDLTQCEARPR